MRLYDKKPPHHRLDSLSYDKHRSPAHYKMPLDTLKQIAFQLVKGLDYLHQKGIIHRNLKCDNILITKDHEVKITDFALSKFVTIPHIAYTPEVSCCSSYFELMIGSGSKRQREIVS